MAFAFFKSGGWGVEFVVDDCTDEVVEAVVDFLDAVGVTRGKPVGLAL